MLLLLHSGPLINSGTGTRNFPPILIRDCGLDLGFRPGSQDNGGRGVKPQEHNKSLDGGGGTGLIVKGATRAGCVSVPWGPCRVHYLIRPGTEKPSHLVFAGQEFLGTQLKWESTGLDGWRRMAHLLSSSLESNSIDSRTGDLVTLK